MASKDRVTQLASELQQFGSHTQIIGGFPVLVDNDGNIVAFLQNPNDFGIAGVPIPGIAGVAAIPGNIAGAGSAPETINDLVSTPEEKNNQWIAYLIMGLAAIVVVTRIRA